MKRPYKLIVFDWDGTLMDSETKIVNCLCAAARDCGLPELDRAVARRVIGLGLAEALGTLFPGVAPPELARLVAAYKEHFLIHDTTKTPLFPGVAEGLENLVQNGYRLAIATGKARRGLERVLAQTGVGTWFCSSRCADEARSKPDPLMLEHILSDTAVDRRDALMIGDTTFDMEMAANAGMARLAVSYGVHPREHLLAHDPLACLNSFADVHAWLN